MNLSGAKVAIEGDRYHCRERESGASVSGLREKMDLKLAFLGFLLRE